MQLSIKTLCTSNNSVKEAKIQPTDGKKIFANNLSQGDQHLVYIFKKII